MAERLEVEPEHESSLFYPAAWEECLRDETFREGFDGLLEQTGIAAAEMDEAPEWVRDSEQLLLRWQHAIEAAGSWTEIGGWQRKNMPHSEYLRASLKLTHDSIDKWGWVTPGLGFKVLQAGFEWLEKEGLELKPRHFEIVDVRDMEEPESLMTISFEEFKALPDEAVTALWTINRANLDRKFIGSTGIDTRIPTRRQYSSDMYKLQRFIRDRRFGVEDCELTYEDVDDYLKDIIAARKAREPGYGELPASYNTLTKPQKEALDSIFDYFTDSRDPAAQSTIDSYSLLRTIGMNRRVAQNLVDKEILQPIGAHVSPAGVLGNYVLATAYNDYWWTSHISDDEASN